MAGLPDRVLSALALVVLLPVLLLIAGVVRLSSPGGVIYRQVRVGQGGVPFRILKFRTMVDGADRLAANVSPTDDPRVTPVGRVLRTWYLDELPQLRQRAARRHASGGPATRDAGVRRPVHAGGAPGARGEARARRSVDARASWTRQSSSPLPTTRRAHYEAVLLHERVRLDLDYLERRSAAYDIQLLLRQALAIISPRSRGSESAADETPARIRARMRGNT